MESDDSRLNSLFPYSDKMKLLVRITLRTELGRAGILKLIGYYTIIYII